MSQHVINIRVRSKQQTFQPCIEMILDFLVFLEHALLWAKHVWGYQKEVCRKWLGPSPQDYYLLENGDILPVTTQLPTHVKPRLYYSTQENVLIGPDKSEKLVRLPWLTLVHVCDGIVTDLTEVICELRCSKYHIPTLLQTVRLAALLRNEYLSETNATLQVTNEMGEDDIYTYKNTTVLVKNANN